MFLEIKYVKNKKKKYVLLIHSPYIIIKKAEMKKTSRKRNPKETIKGGTPPRKKIGRITYSEY